MHKSENIYLMFKVFTFPGVKNKFKSSISRRSSVVKEFLVSIFLNKPPGQNCSPGRSGGSEEAAHFEGGAEGQEARARVGPGGEGYKIGSVWSQDMLE